MPPMPPADWPLWTSSMEPRAAARSRRRKGKRSTEKAAASTAVAQDISPHFAPLSRPTQGPPGLESVRNAREWCVTGAGGSGKKRGVPGLAGLSQGPPPVIFPTHISRDVLSSLSFHLSCFSVAGVPVEESLEDGKHLVILCTLPLRLFLAELLHWSTTAQSATLVWIRSLEASIPS